MRSACLVVSKSNSACRLKCSLYSLGLGLLAYWWSKLRIRSKSRVRSALYSLVKLAVSYNLTSKVCLKEVCLNIKSANALDTEEGWASLGLEWSNLGLITQFKSPPKINRCVFKAGRLLSNLFAKPASSKLGAYTLTSKTGVCCMVLVTIKYLPLGSEIELVGMNCVRLWINMATPLAFELKVEWKTWLTQDLRNLTWSDCAYLLYESYIRV